MPRRKNPNPEPEHRVTVRFKEHEFMQIEADMEALNYKSYTKYIKAMTLSKTIRKYPKTGKITDRQKRDQVNAITKEINKIGNNINQYVTRINTLAAAKKKNGDPAINTRYLTYYVQKLDAPIQKIIELQEKIIEITENSTES